MTREIEVGHATKEHGEVPEITLKGTSTLVEFFGVMSLTKVDFLNLQIAINVGRPDWLQGVAKARDLPRKADGGLFEFRFISPATEAGRAAVAAWVVENCNGAWDINERFVLFEDLDDAVHYRLKWE